jgi:sterol desaturase/sphingolipid hydroxylase (fatty acid hydroxylase superfamily)
MNTRRYPAILYLFRFGTFPALLLGFNGALVALIGAGAPLWQPLLVLLGAIGFMFAAERVVPYVSSWNGSHGDRGRDLLHFLVNTTSNHLGIWLLPLTAGLALFPGRWPTQWPFWAQVLLAILALDLGVSAAHHASHQWRGLWRFHAVHHSVQRLYGFNGLMKHPVHQALEASSGFVPLVFLGIPVPVATALAFCVAVQLLLQHSNADYRSGFLKYWFANAEVHRFHHRKGGMAGNVNFGLFTTLWDHAAGTFAYAPGAAPTCSEQLGIEGADDYPQTYIAQLLQPFRKQSVRSSQSVEIGPS